MEAQDIPRIEIPVLYDFASTICYIAHRTTERMCDDLEERRIDLVWRPVDLSRITGWPRGIVVEGPRRDNALRVARELGVEVRMPAAWLDSRRAHAVALALTGDAREVAWRERVWSAVFEEGRDIGNDLELERIGRDIGIEVNALAREEEIARLESTTETAQENGVNGVPTFVLGGFPLGGIQEPATMLSLLGRYAERQRAAG
jgi:predicted DsbA family dithiol-disulfide isomerase